MSDKAATGDRSETSIDLDGREPNGLRIDQQSRALPAESMVAGTSLGERSIHGPKPLTVAGLKESLIQIMEDADLNYTGRLGMGEKNIGDAIMRTAYSHLEDQASLMAYVGHLEKTVASLRNSLRSGIDLSTPGSPILEASVASVHDSRPEPPENAVGNCIVEVKRWKEIVNDSEDGPRELVDNALAFNDKTEKKRTTRTGHVLISYSEYNEDEVHITTRLEVNSIPLIQTLQSVIHKYPKVVLETLGLEEVVLFEPYMMIFHHYKRLHEEHSKLEGQSKAHLGLLLDYVKDECPKVSETIIQITENSIKTIGFNELWLLYPPDTIVYTKIDDELRAYRVIRLSGFHRSLKVKGLFTSLEIECSVIQFNTTGNELVNSVIMLMLSHYTGMQAISDLRVIPASYLPEEAAQRELLIARGQRYWDYRDTGHFQSYFGTAWLTATPKDGHRVMIDYSTSSRTQDRKRHSDGIEWEFPEEIVPQKKSGKQRHEIEEEQMETLSENGSDEFTFSDPDKLLCCPTEVRAFSLRDKSWKSVKVSQLGPVKFREDAFKKLVIKGKHKTVVKAMVRAHLSKEPTPGDLIQGKGRGLIVLLHGSPGTGKTLTAECVAEKENRPLYMVTCGDLGTEPDDLEKRLKDVFEYAVNWNAVLLLDEADVFLQERDVHDLKRNALVSVFLRELEYFDGVLFLTTNRPGSLDEAFQSRIHVTIGLPELDAKSQLEVWTIFVKDLNIEKSEKMSILEFVDEDIKKNGNLNGRQIRNSVRTALAIAAQMSETISKKHVRDVLEIGRDFTKYLQDVNRMNQQQRAAALGHRAPVVN